MIPDVLLQLKKARQSLPGSEDSNLASGQVGASIDCCSRGLCMDLSVKMSQQAGWS